MTPDKELKPLTHEIADLLRDCETDNDLATSIISVLKERGHCADQPPPLLDEVREVYSELHSKLDEIACLGNAHGIHGNSHGNVLARQALKMLEAIRAATQQPEVVTVEGMTMLIQDWKFNEENQQPFFGSYLAKRFPHGIKIVEG